MPPFSRRTAWDTSESTLSEAIRQRRAAGLPLLDLTISNPTVCGFHYDAEALLAPLASPAALIYDPDPRGIVFAREAVAGYYASHNAQVSPGQLILTTSTSEAYSFLFRLLCDPGDQILVAQPSYPLFDFLADLDDIQLTPYPLFYDFGWWIDFAELERRITPRTRALVLVHPNNPTGHATNSSERAQLQDLCARHHLALIVDEVFLDYGLNRACATSEAASPCELGTQQTKISTFATGDHPCLTFVVSGLSKIAALPQMKVGWLACFGPKAARSEALARLEVVADTFLSMNAPAQFALPAWLATRHQIVPQIVARVRENLSILEQGIGSTQVLPVEAGWSVILKLPQRRALLDSAEELVRASGIVVHPGAFYGLPHQGFMVASLIAPPETLAQALPLFNRWCEPNELT